MGNPLHALQLTTALLGCALLPAQTLLSDLNRASVDPGSGPGPAIELNGATYFAATETNLGRELFRLDRLGGVPTLVADLAPGRANSSPRHFVVSGGLLYFTAAPGLYSTDGTAAGTVLLSPGLYNPQPHAATANGIAFIVPGGLGGTTLWFSDGTLAGTIPILASMPAGFIPTSSATIGGDALFLGVSSLSPWRHTLVRTDGTAQGSSVVFSQFGGTVGELEAMANNRVLVTGQDLNDLPTVFGSDGTLLGTQTLMPGAPGVGWRILGPFATGALLAQFVTTGPGTGVTRLWRTDGTPAGTVPVQGNEVFDHIQSVGMIGNQGVFSATGPLFGTALFATDGTTYRLVKRLASTGHAFVEVGSVTFFAAADLAAPNNTELWASDGTTAGTFQVADIRPGNGPSRPFPLLAVGSELLFNADNGVNGRELWRSDSTAMGTTQIADLRSTPGNQSSDPENFLEALGLTWFTAVDSDGLQTLWSTDGTTTTQRDELIAPTHKEIDLLAEVRNRLFVAQRGSVEFELRSTDGVTAQPVAQGRTIRSSDAHEAAREGRLLFFTGDLSNGHELWEADATGSRVLASFPTVQLAGQPYALGQDVLFTAVGPSGDEELWSMSAGGPLLDLTPVGTSFPLIAGRIGSQMLFVVSGGVHGSEMWATDGTAGGTRLLVDIYPGARNGAGHLFTRLDDTIYFAAEEPGSARTIWQTKGTSASTRRTIDLTRSTPLSRVDHLFAHAGKIYVFMTTSPPGRELIAVDLQTLQITTLMTGALDELGNPTALGSRRVLFTVRNLTQSTLWETDGTVAGTRALTPPTLDVPAVPAQLHVRQDGTVLFTADDGLTGREPWVLDAGAIAQAFIAGGCAQFLKPRLVATDPVLGTTMQVTLIDGMPSAGGLLFLGFPGRLNLGSGCQLAVNPSLPIVGQPIAVSPNGQGSAVFPIPNDTSLSGLDLRMQALLGPSGMPQGGPVFGYDLTNAVALRLGR